MQKGLRSDLIRKIKHGRMKREHRAHYNQVMEEGMRTGKLKNVLLAFSDADIARLALMND